MAHGAEPNPAKAWRCILGCAIALLGSAAPAFLAPFSVLAGPMSLELDWTRGALFTAISLFAAGGVLFSPLSGLLLDRLGARPLALAGILILPCTIALLGLVPADYSIFIAATTLVAIIGAISSPAIYLSVIVRRFDRMLGFAIALTMAGLGLGQGLSALLTQYYLEMLGWRGAWFGIAATSVTLGLIAFAIIPWRALSSHAAKRATLHEAPAARPVIWSVLLRSPLFWTLSTALLLVLMVASGVSLNLVTALRDRGFSGMYAASLAAAVPLAAIAGRLLTGALVDRMSYIIIGAILFAGQAVGCVLLVSSDALPAAYLAVILIGLGYGAESDLLPYVIKRRLGATFFGSIYGLMFGIIQIGVMVGPFLGAHIFDATGSYRPAFAGFACSSLVAVCLWILSRWLTAPVLEEKAS